MLQQSEISDTKESPVLEKYHHQNMFSQNAVSSSYFVNQLKG
jgi:hypothetical protein